MRTGLVMNLHDCIKVSHTISNRRSSGYCSGLNQTGLLENSFSSNTFDNINLRNLKHGYRGGGKSNN
ncbi:unnamed protein product [Lactuca virosa]|uniref:Uncharacterized protein n=1 Tax=Lactuca virosa TaxID=75947 RepID=A0AAU9PUY9_9ASTR|nr:unnamed protein product [Lactuca virosa]